MANILTIEVGSTEIRVAEMREEKKSSSIRRCFRFAVPQGLVEDGTIRDAQTLGEQLKNPERFQQERFDLLSHPVELQVEKSEFLLLRKTEYRICWRRMLQIIFRLTHWNIVSLIESLILKKREKERKKKRNIILWSMRVQRK